MEEKMVMKKVTLSAILLTCPWLVMADGHHRQQQQQQQGAGLSIDALRHKCEGFRGNTQIKNFSVEGICDGFYTKWVKSVKSFGMHKHKSMWAHASTKDGRYETLPSESNGSLASHIGACEQWDKTMMSLPQGFSLPLTFGEDDCDELTEENLFRLCENEIHEYCDENFVVEDLSSPSQSQQQQQQQQGQAQQQQQQQKRSDGMCVLRTVDSVNTCQVNN
jgi:hypothetical protein